MLRLNLCLAQLMMMMCREPAHTRLGGLTREIWFNNLVNHAADTATTPTFSFIRFTVIIHPDHFPLSAYALNSRQKS